MLSLSSRTASRFSLAQAVQQTVCLALLALSLLPRVDALYFYLKAGEQKCFLEELPNHTIVVGKQQLSLAFDDVLGISRGLTGALDAPTGQYKAEEWSPEDQTFVINEKLGIQITVEVCQISVPSARGAGVLNLVSVLVLQEVDSKERIVNTRGSPEGKFTFTSHDRSVALLVTRISPEAHLCFQR